MEGYTFVGIVDGLTVVPPPHPPEIDIKSLMRPCIQMHMVSHRSDSARTIRPLAELTRHKPPDDPPAHRPRSRGRTGIVSGPRPIT